MTKELTQLDRAVRFAEFIECVSISHTGYITIDNDILIDAHAIAEEFQRLLEDARRRADHAREIGRKGGRPRLKKPSKATLAKRRSRAKQTR